MTESDVSFLNPPVREVNLTIWFEPIHTLASLHLSPLRTTWSDLVQVEEKAPLAPWNLTDSISISTDKWPMPACIFATHQRDKQVLVQNDRFSLTWTFSHGSPYPGFVDLNKEFRRRYLDFLEALHQSQNPDPVTTRATIEYENLLEKFDSNVVARRLTTNEPIRLEDRGLTEVGSTAVRKHASKPDDKAISTLVGVDSAGISDALLLEEDDLFSKDAGESARPNFDITGPVSLLTLGGRVEVAGKEDPFERLQAAHDATLEVFHSLFDDSLKVTWGAR